MPARRIHPTSLATKAIHGLHLKAFRGPLTTPLVQTSTYRFEDSGDALRYAQGDPDVYVYTRYHNPTVKEVQDRLALMTGAQSALLFSSGMAAISSTIFAAAKAGDAILSTPGLYGGTYRFFRDILPSHNLDVQYIRSDAPEDILRLATKHTAVVYFETPTNPTLDIVDIRAVVKATRKAERRTGRRITIICDNTFATVLNQNPLELGVDVVVESCTKYLGGHSDILAGMVAGTKRFVSKVHTQLKYFGGSADPFAAWLLLRSLKTFELRVARQNENAMTLARYLQRHHKIARVIYPGLPSHPRHSVAKRQMQGFGGIVTVEVKGGLKAAVKLVDSLRVAVNAMSLGGVETLVSVPLYSSHINMTDEELKRHGVRPGMIRISVGVEGIEDLKRDFWMALGGG